MILRLYGRFSPRRDANECESCKGQLKDLREWATQKHTDVPYVEYSDEDVSGKSTKGRADFLKMINEVKRGDIVVVRNLERFSRNFEDTIIYAAQLRSLGVRIYSLESGFYEEEHNRAQKLLSIIRAQMAEWEREDKSKATKKAMHAMSMRRELTGRYAQYGCDRVRDGTRVTRNGTVLPKYIAVPNAKQMVCITVIMELHSQGHSVDQILSVLNRDYREAQPQNSIFTKRLISRIIKREINRHSQLE